ncbi:MAG: aminopeptidase P N-terminal domain-containing protein, partial [Clostridiales bacterium]|nr:aminopeptidase P N-terminal domain-containing protein [Clostridiales bacterium]
MNSKFFKKNRDNLAERFDKNSLFVIFAGFAPFRRGDELYEFTPQRNFYYLTGLDNPNIIFSLYKDNNGKITEKLFLERFDEVEAKWVGEVIQKEEAKEKSGIGEFGFIDEFESYASKILFDKMPTVCFDLENRTFYAPLTPDVAFANKLKERFPALTIKDVRSDFAWLRAVKSPEEIEEIKSAISITNEGISSMMKNAFNEMYEYEAEAYFDFELKRRGAEYAFKSIVASGKNATILHYVNNNTKSSNGDLLLCDVGAAHGFYSSDITRTFPISGKFSERQKQI